MPGDIFGDVLMKRFQYRADKDPNKDGFVFVSQTMSRIPLSRFQIWDLCGRYACRLSRYGIKTGDVVCSMMKTSRTKLITTFGVIAAGGVFINGLAMLNDGQDIFRVLNTSKSETILTSWNNPEFVFLQKYLQMRKSPSDVGFETIIPVQCDQAPCLKQLIVYKLNSHEDHTAFISSLADEDFYEADVDADDEAYIFLTSGSTSYSKMVPRTHRECLAIADSIQQDVDIVLNNRKMEWIGGFPSLYLGSGATTIVQEYLDGSGTLNVADMWNFACDEGASAAVLLPPEVMTIKQAFDDGKITRRIKRIISGAQPIRRCLFELMNVICDEYMAMYGSSDMGYCVIGLITSDMKETVKDCYTGDRLAGNTKMKIVDEKTNMEVTCPNQLGKLFFKGGTILRHYLDGDSTLSGVFKDDGWFDSTDMGYIDEVGGVHVIGRTSDVIVCGPVIVYPQWLEDRIIKCPGVAGVVVVGIHHPVRFQELCVCVVREKSSTLTEGELMTFCKEIFIENPNCDDEIPKKFFFLDSFPLTSTGKTWRKELERLATEHFQR